MNEIERNLVDFYVLTSGYEKCLMINNDHFSAIRGEGNSWPCMVFNLNYSLPPETLVRLISDKIERQKVPPYFLASTNYLNRIHHPLLRDYGFYPYDCWQMMEISLAMRQPAGLNPSGVHFHKITGNDELTHYSSMLNDDLLHTAPIEAGLLEYYLARPEIEIWGLFAEQQLVTASVLFTQSGKTAFHLAATRKNKQRMGFGTLLLQYLLNYLQEKGIEKVMLQSSRKGFALFDNAGFEPTGELYIYFKAY